MTLSCEVTTYDDVAVEYEQQITGPGDAHTAELTRMVLALTGPGPGRCVDVGCGTGVVSNTLTDAGWTVVGIDMSRVEIGIATEHKRVAGAAVGDALRLPVRSQSADLVLSTYTHTDVLSWKGTLLRAADAVRPDGACVYVGMHPAFAGAHAQRIGGVTVLHSGYYQDRSLRFDGPGLTPGGWRQTVGVRHRTLGDLLNAFPTAGLSIELVTEGAYGGPVPGGADVPWLIGIRARKT